MATTVLFYTFTGDPKAIDKSSYLSLIPVSKSCQLTSPCDVETPELILGYSSSDLKAYNYCYISEFGRYYFITARETDAAGMLRLQLQSDPLYSFKSDITAWDVIISRSAQTFEQRPTYTKDPLLPLASDREVKTYKFKDDNNPFNVDKATSTSYNYVLYVAGREQS